MAQARRLKQPLLGPRITIHVAVVIEMVTRQIGEQRDAERDPVDAILIQPDR